MKAILTAIYDRLKVDTGGGTNPVRTAVSDRIYQIEAPASSPLPLVVFGLSNLSTSHAFGGREGVTGTLVVSVVGKTQVGVAALADIEDEVFTLLDRQNLLATGYGRVYLRVTNRGVPANEGEYTRLDSSLELVAHATS